MPKVKNRMYRDMKEGKKFQIKTDKKIDGSKYIMWYLGGVGSYLKFTNESVFAPRCLGTGNTFSDEDRKTMGFFLRAGVLTFLKTRKQLQIWFDGDLEVTWVYADKDADNRCVLRKAMAGVKFTHGVDDQVSTHYRYEIGNEIEFQFHDKRIERFGTST